ncbi:MAG: hypothetical protein PVSMB4_18730 [Ktedonobacterales bacterium]
MRRVRCHRVGGWLLAWAFVTAITLVLAACSGASGSGSGSLPLTLAGAGTGNGDQMPTISGNDPGGHYAFVYGNQIWIKLNNDPRPRQLTHLPLASGAYFAWGPLAWSPDGSSIAFALVQDLSPGHYERTTGPLFVVNTATGDVQATAGTGSIFGHTYAWYGNSAVFYSLGTLIAYYDLSDPSDPRPWTGVRVNNPDFSTGEPHYISFGDIAFAGHYLLATRIDAATLGVTGRVGRAQVVRYAIDQAPDAYAGGELGISQYGAQVADLHQAYADAHGNLSAGAWQIAPNGGMVYQQVNGTDLKAGTVSATVCYDASLGDGCDAQLFKKDQAEPITARPQFGFSHGGSLVAMAGATVDTQQTDTGHFASYTPGGWGAPPAWSPDGKMVVATQLVSATPDANGVIHYDTNVVAYQGGGQGAVLIAGARSFSWGP